MKNIIISIFFAFGLLTNLVANDLTQENVKSFLLDSDRLVLSKNVDKLGELLDENVDITINVDFNGNKQKTKLILFQSCRIGKCDGRAGLCP